MKIFKAQKKVKRLKGEINNLADRIQNTISTLANNKYEESYTDLIQEHFEKVTELIKLKVAIHEQNIKHGMFKQILELGETKNKLNLIKSLNVRIGEVNEGYRLEKPIEYKSQLTVKEKNQIIKDLENAIVQMTDKLDDFNAVTDIEL